MPASIEEVALTGTPVWCEARVRSHEPDLMLDLTLWDASEAVVGRMGGLKLARLDGGASDPLWETLLAVEWVPAEAPVPVGRGRWRVVGTPQIAPEIAAALQARGAVLADERDETLSGVVCVSGWQEALGTVQALASHPRRDPPRVVLVTRGSQSVRGEAVEPEEAPLWGLGGTVRSEHPGLRPLRIDLDGRDGAEMAAQWALSDSDEDQVAVRGGESFVARLVRPDRFAGRRVEAAKGRPYRLEVQEAGRLDRLGLVGFEREAPGPGEVELAIEAAGLNFRDVLLASGVIPPMAGALQLGFEAVGRVERAGPGVDLPLGVRVLALGAGLYATHAKVSAELVFPLPDCANPVAAAGIGIAHATAYYALHHVARLESGERVLIHSAASGVGLVALHWARHLGSEVIATVGTEEKRAWLRSLGVERISDSRSDRFVADVRSWTSGRGVDVAVNALAGDLGRRTLELLRPGGRFVELGLRDALSDGTLPLSPFARNLAYTLVNLGALIQDSPAKVRRIMAEVLEHVRSGVLPPLPQRVFPLSRAGEALWEMARGQHIGKFVVEVAEASPPVIAVSGECRLRADGSYLVTGGLGGLGLSLGRWMAKHGAGHLVLLGRGGIGTPEVAAQVEAMRASGTRVTVAQADVGDAAALAEVLAAADGPAGGGARGGGPRRRAAGGADAGAVRAGVPAEGGGGAEPGSSDAWGDARLLRAVRLGGVGAGEPGPRETMRRPTLTWRRWRGGGGAKGCRHCACEWGAFAEVGLAHTGQPRRSGGGARPAAVDPGPGRPVVRAAAGDLVHAGRALPDRRAVMARLLPGVWRPGPTWSGSSPRVHRRAAAETGVAWGALPPQTTRRMPTSSWPSM